MSENAVFTDDSKFDVDTQQLLDRRSTPATSTTRTRWTSSRSRSPGEFWSIRVEDAYKSFGSNAVLNGLNLGIPEGMITVVLGPSGTGKSGPDQALDRADVPPDSGRHQGAR